MANIAEVLKELQQERDRLDQAIAALQPLARTTNEATQIRRTGRILSAAARRRMAAAQKARWAKVNSGSATKVRTNSTRPARRVLSIASRRKIAAAKKAWWAKQKKAA
jgi:hypothetical protein